MHLRPETWRGVLRRGGLQLMAEGCSAVFSMRCPAPLLPALTPGDVTVTGKEDEPQRIVVS